MNAQLKIGDVVRLKSGGPPMTVTHVTPKAGVMITSVEWFKDGSELMQQTFASDALTKLTHGVLGWKLHNEHSP